MRSFLLTISSLALTAGVVANAYYQKKQFYPSVVYITKSSPSMAVLYIQAFVFVILMGKLMRKLFFGQLRAAEMEHLIERSWYAVTETCLAFTVFRDDFSPRFVALFTLLLFLKCFHWLAEDRVDYMERSPVISFLFHSRVIMLLSVLGMVDAYFINHAYYSTLMKGASVQLVFGFEYAILFTAVVHIFVKYILHGIDLQSENPWENKAVYLLYTELILGFLKVVLYILFLAIMIKVHTFPLFAIRPMYLTIRTFKKALSDVIMSRRAIRNMNTLYPDATAEELASGDNVCIICREDMLTSCKKLPCSHIFHTSCLRSWFQRQQTCPTCRMDVLRPPATPTPAPQAPPPAQPGPAPPQQPMQQPPPFLGGFPGWQMPPQPVPPAGQQPQAAASSAGSTAGSTEGTATPAPVFTAAAAAAAMPNFMMPPFMMPMPFNIPPPMPPPDYSGLTEEELRQMEGSERAAVEARIQVLRNVHTLLDAAVLQLQQYTSVVASSSPPPSMGRQEYGWPSSGGAPASSSSSSSSSSTPGSQGAAAAADAAAATSLSTSTSTTSVLQKPVSSSTNNTPAPAEQEAAGSGGGSSNTNQDDSLEGAVGYTPPPSQDELIPHWQEDEEQEGLSDEMSEVRRRRLQKFSSSASGEAQEGDNNVNSGGD